jgi:transposase InsO family protein
MPWKETNTMDERVRFIGDLESCLYTMTELCERYGISRKTGYKWAERYVAEGVDGLKDRSRAPKRCPHRMGKGIARAVVELRMRHPQWGPRKLLTVLGRRHPDWSLPAASSVGALLKRQGLIKARPRRRSPSPASAGPRWPVDGPNDLWTSDFKGQFLTGDHRYCYPLTIADRYSRYLLGCESLPSTGWCGVRPVFERVFRDQGLPGAILTDNGSPFASQAICRLSRLSVWWIKLGIQPLLIQPGHPEQNGSHERMHRTLKAHTARPPAGSLQAQQKRFVAFRREFNQERPHEALGQRPPAEVYRASRRPYPERLEPMEYPGHYEARSVRTDGCIKFHGQMIFLSEVLHRERVGLVEIDDGIWSVYFGPLLLGRLEHGSVHIVS